MTDATASEDARPDEVAFDLSWSFRPAGGLAGNLTVQNVGGRTFALHGKPGLVALGMDLLPLDARCIVSMEARIPDFVELAPAAHAAATVSWAGWPGPPASGVFRVRCCESFSVDVLSRDFEQPGSHRTATNLSSSWWKLL